MPFQYSAQNSLNSFTNNSHVLSVTVPSGLTNSVMVIIKDCNNDLPWSTYTGITVNGSSTGIVDIGNSGAALANRSLRAWYLLAPASGTYNVSINFNTSSSNGGALTVLVFDAINQVSPIAAFQAVSGGSVSSPIAAPSIATPSGGFGIFSARAFGGSALTPSAGTNVGSIGESSVSYLLNGTSTSFSWTGTSPTQASAIAIALTPASGGGSTAQGTTVTATASIFGGAATGGVASGTFTSEVLRRNNGTVAASIGLNYVRFYNISTGALVLTRAGLSTNGAGVFTTTDAALVAGTTYAIDWEEVGGQRRMPRKAAT